MTLIELHHRIIIGTYKIQNKETIFNLVSLAHSNGFYRYDTAQMYRNEKLLSDELKNIDSLDKINGERGYEYKVTTKLSYDCNINKANTFINKAKEYFKENDSLEYILVHHPMDLKTLNLIKDSMRFGVSNYSIKDLKVIIDNGIIPEINQIEFHPFVPVCDIINFCKKYNIKIQGHTLLAQKKYFGFTPLVEMSKKYNCTPAQIMLRWAYQHGIDLVLSSKNDLHMKEWLGIADIVISDFDMMSINGYHLSFPNRFYNNIKKPHIYLSLPHEKDEYISKCSEILISDLHLLQEKKDVSNMGVYLNSVSFNTIKDDTILQQIAMNVADPFNEYIDSDISDPHYKANHLITVSRRFVKLLNLLRNQWYIQEARPKTKIRSCAMKPTLVNSEAVLHPTPMPVTIPDSDNFNPFFDYLINGEVTGDIITIKGAYFTDGRMDLCKQVVGYKNIKQLCETVMLSDKVKHFLLGNNIAFETNEEDGAKSMAKLIENDTKKIETWYLAGNCIGEKAIEILSKAFETNTVANALWLKRNPINSGTKYLCNMLNINTSLVLLDLHNCGLQNDGLSELCLNLTNNTLKHLYLDANGITELKPLIHYILTKGKLESLYISMNKLSEYQTKNLILALHNNEYLERLCLASCSLTDTFQFDLFEIPNLKMLDLGWYKSTNDMGENPNSFTDVSINKIHRLMNRHLNLEYISLLVTGLKHQEILDNTLNSKCTTLFTGYSKYCHSESELKLLRHPGIVKNIESIYRGM